MNEVTHPPCGRHRSPPGDPGPFPCKQEAVTVCSQVGVGKEVIRERTLHLDTKGCLSEFPTERQILGHPRIVTAQLQSLALSYPWPSSCVCTPHLPRPHSCEGTCSLQEDLGPTQVIQGGHQIFTSAEMFMLIKVTLTTSRVLACGLYWGCRGGGPVKASRVEKPPDLALFRSHSSLGLRVRGGAQEKAQPGMCSRGAVGFVEVFFFFFPSSSFFLSPLDSVSFIVLYFSLLF